MSEALRSHLPPDMDPGRKEDSPSADTLTQFLADQVRRWQQGEPGREIGNAAMVSRFAGPQ